MTVFKATTGSRGAASRRSGVRFAARGFTLMELVVTIVIVAIVLALSIAGVNEGIERARGAGCVSNLKQIGSLIILYTQDHQGSMPPATLNAGTVIWYRELYPYAGIAGSAAGMGVFKCPGKKKEEGTGHSYAIDYNATLGGGATPPPLKWTAVMTPGALTPPAQGQRWLVIDGSWYFIQVGKGSSAPEKATRFRHSGRANVLFPDFSVRPLTKSEINAGLYLYKTYPVP